MSPSIHKTQTSIAETKPLVQFLIGGVQKAGTTALHEMLRKHPELHMPKRKELHFFDNDALYSQSSHNYDRYHLDFSNRAAMQLCGDATPSYIFVDDVAQRVKQYNSAMKWIIILRDPVSRAYSHWNMQHNRGIEPLNFRAAINEEPNRLSSLPAIDFRKFAYLARSLYAPQIERLLAHFDTSQILFLSNEMLSKQSEQTLHQITEFLGVSEFNTSHVFSHVGSYQKKLSNEVSRELAEYFKSDIATTQKLTRLDLRSWMTYRPN